MSRSADCRTNVMAYRRVGGSTGDREFALIFYFGVAENWMARISRP
jgi:hypothetical protein